MDERFSARSEQDPQPTMPHLPPVPARDEDAALTRPAGVPPVTAYPPSQPPAPAATPYAGPSQRAYAAPERDPRRRARSRRRQDGEWAWLVVALAMIGVTLVASLSIFMILRSSRADAFVEDDGMVAASATSVVILPTAMPNFAIESANPGAGQPTLDPANLGIEPWDGTERFTVLLMGWDRRPGDPPDAAYRTDTMMLASLDPATGRIGVLSIPRDLYVNIPGYNQLQRVNSAYVLGELRQPGYGPHLAMETVQYNLGMRIHDYLIVDFNAFITVIDAIGGIDVDVETTINDPQYPDMFYGYEPFYLPAGQHHLDGATALKYARTRHGSNDFRRAERQQQVLFAIRDQALNVANLPQLVVAAPTIWASIREGVRTGLTFDQLLRLAWYVKDIPAENIRTGVIDEHYISFYTTPDGQSVVIPNRYALGPLMVEVFGETYNQ